jgi:aldose 1-epimerase
MADLDRDRREAARHPSGRQYEIVRGDQRAVVVQVGGGLREYEVDGFPVLDGYGPDELADSGRGQVLMPWPNRLADGRYEFDGGVMQLPLSEPERRNAIHGLVRWASWEEVRFSRSRVRLGHVLFPRAGYPFALALEVDYELTGEGLRVTMSARNIGRRPAPFGAGQHPYVRAQMAGIDGCVLGLPGRRWMEMDERQIPTGRLLPVEGTEFDFLAPRPIASTRMDTAFFDLERGPDGRARAELRSEDGTRRVTVWMERGFEYLMIFTGDSLPAEERRRSLGVEPMSCAPDAFRNGLGLVVLRPGQSWSSSWGIAVG